MLAAVLAGCGADGVLLGIAREDVPETIALTATASGTTAAVLNWSSAGENLAYQVERNGTTVTVTEGLQATDSGLVAGQRFCWRVFARSGFGWQARSNEACLGTAPDTTDWRVERIATGGRWPAIAIDAAGDLHVCQTGPSGGIAYLRVGPGRTPETVDADGSGRCSIAVDAAGSVRIAYLSRFGLRHATRGRVAWTAETVDAEALAGVERFDGPSIALGPDGLPRIAYRRLAGNGDAALAVVTRGNLGWTFDLTGIRGLVGPRSLAVDAAGTAWLASTDALGQAATVWRRVIGGWSAAYSHSLAPTRGEGPPLALDATGQPRTAWWQRSAPTTTAATTLRWAESASAGWRAEAVATVETAGFGVAAAISGDVPRVVAIDVTGTLRIHTRGADGWTVQTLAEQGGATAAADLAIGPDGQLRLVFDRIVEGSVMLASRTP